MLEALGTLFGSLGLDWTAILVAGVIGGATLTTVVTVRKHFKKRGIIKKVRKSEAKIRELNNSKTKDMRKIRSQVKKHYRNRLRLAKLNIAIGNERNKTSRNYSLKRLNKRDVKREKAYAKLILEELKENPKTKKVEKYKDIISENQNEYPGYIEKIQMPKFYVELATNSIVSENTQIVNEYKEDLKREFGLRSKDSAIYPMITEIRDRDDNTILKISDVSPERFVNYSQKLMSTLLNRVEKMEHNREDVYFKLVSYDSVPKRKRNSTSYLLLEKDITSVKSLKEVAEEHMNFTSNFTESHGKPANVVENIESFAKVYSFQKEFEGYQLNKVNFSDTRLASRANRLVQNVKLSIDGQLLKEAPSNPKLLCLSVGGVEVASILVDTKSDEYIAKSEFLKFGTVIAKITEAGKMSKEIKVYTKTIKNDKLIQNELNKFDSAEVAYKSLKIHNNKFDAEVREYANDFGYEGGFIAEETTEKPVVKDETKPTRKPVESKDDPIVVEVPFVPTSFSSNLENVRKRLSRFAKNAKTEEKGVVYDAVVSAGKKGSERLKVTTTSKVFYDKAVIELLLEAYVYAEKQIAENGGMDPVTIDPRVIGKTDEKLKEKTFKNLKALQKEILTIIKSAYKGRADEDVLFSTRHIQIKKAFENEAHTHSL